MASRGVTRQRSCPREHYRLTSIAMDEGNQVFDGVFTVAEMLDVIGQHQDTALPLRRQFSAEEWGPWSTKGGVLYAHAPAWALEQVVALRISLDDSSAANGPLRVLPHTHMLGVLTDARIAALTREKEAVDCVAASGSVVAMRPLTVHASSKATVRQPRRVLHIEYAAALDLGSGIELTVA